MQIQDNFKDWVDARCVFTKCKNRSKCYEVGYICPAMSNIPIEFDPIKQRIIEVRIEKREHEYTEGIYDL